MTPLFGQTRTVVTSSHALITPDGHVGSIAPGIKGARVVAHITPAMGAGFAQSTIIFEPKGSARFEAGPTEYFFYVQGGKIEADVRGKARSLTPGSYLFSPASQPIHLRATGAAATIICFEKTFVPLGELRPEAVVGHSRKVEGKPFMNNPKALLQVLLPEDPAFDMAVNIFTYQPGATLPFVETHIMEHGLLMLAGQGVYRLDESWYPVAAGDIIWMAPYCPQWFVAMGDAPASYLYYKDVHRPFLAP
jgi:(S)-ureidoglycine aminohydrolase